MTLEFIEDAKKVHGDKYDYSLVEYVNWETKIKVTCNLCKRVFEISPNNHTNGRGCKQCGVKRRVKASRMGLEEFVKRAQIKHNNKYDYSKSEYKNSQSNVIIICPIHSDFQQSPSNHLVGRGCLKCGQKTTAEKRCFTNDIFIKKSNAVHNNFYDYSKVDYINSGTKVIIGCPTHKDFFEQEANSHLHGAGCPKCSLDSNGYRRSHYIKLAETSTLYLVKIFNKDEVFYKIGKTINETKKRFSGKNKLPYEYSVINEYTSEIGEIYDLEVVLHRKYKIFKYTPKICFGGYTECYTTDLPIEELIKLNT